MKKKAKLTLIILGIIIGIIWLIIAGIVLNTIIGAIILGTALNGNYSKEKMDYYEKAEVRINYFKKHKDSFNYIAKLFEENKELKGIKYRSDICLSEEIEIKLSKKISLCSTSDISEKINKEKILTSLEELDEIVKITLRTNDNYKSNKTENVAVSFYIISSVNASVHYNYCLSNELCDSKNDYHKTDEGEEYIKNNINDKWSSIFDKIPSM